MGGNRDKHNERRQASRALKATWGGSYEYDNNLLRIDMTLFHEILIE